MKYINDFSIAVENSSSLQDIKNIELKSYLSSKTYEAINKNIDFRINIFSDLNDIKTASFNIIKVVSNLLDNAFQHAETQDNKFVVLDIKKVYELYQFTVTNSGSIVDTYERMFNNGFTTKETGSGYGLIIVQEILEVCGGKIDIISFEPVVIRVIIP